MRIITIGLIFVFCVCPLQTVYAQSSSAPRTAFVHLFEWSWLDVAIECEQHWGPKGFAAVQVSPPQESPQGPEWWRRYQPLSYEIINRSGDRTAFADMVRRCRAVGVDIKAERITAFYRAAKPQ